MNNKYVVYYEEVDWKKPVKLETCMVASGMQSDPENDCPKCTGNLETSLLELHI